MSTGVPSFPLFSPLGALEHAQYMYVSNVGHHWITCIFIFVLFLFCFRMVCVSLFHLHHNQNMNQMLTHKKIKIRYYYNFFNVQPCWKKKILYYCLKNLSLRLFFFLIKVTLNLPKNALLPMQISMLWRLQCRKWIVDLQKFFFFCYQISH